MKRETEIVHGSIQPDQATGAIVPPIYQTSTYVLDEVGTDKGFDYTRSANPTRQLLEEHLAILEGGRHAVAFASGMAAVDSCLRLLKAGDHVICSDDVYGGVSRLFDQLLVNSGLEVTYVDTQQPENVLTAIQDHTRMIWIETPTNPLLKITDVEEIGRIAEINKLIYVVDSTFATPVFLQPLTLGAQIVLHSTTKYISGHNQLIGGIAITNDDDIAERLRFIQKTVGAVPGPFDCWLTIQGVKTLYLRMQKHWQNARQVAEFLEAHPAVKRVIYPGLPSHPGHSIAKSQMSGFRGMI